MAMDFSKIRANSAPTAAPTAEPDGVEKYDIVADREEMNRTLTNSAEVDALASQIDVGDMDTIVSFGAHATEEISRAADMVLNSMSLAQLDNTGVMMTALGKIMDHFDIDEIREEPGFFAKIFGGMKKQLEKILAKYHTMGEDVEKIYVQLKQYEAEIRESNKKLQTMFDACVSYYHELVKYILAGEQGCREITAYIAERRQEMERTGDRSITFELQSLEQALAALEQRTQDLRIAENVAMQSIPMIKTMQFSNYSLIRKINTAFVITLPVFKQALAQAIMLKRQRIQADAMSALDQRTNELLLRNAQDSARTSADITRLASTSSVKIETLEASWKTIMDGIDETRKIQEDARRQREEDQVRLARIKESFHEKFSMPKANQ
ncbi:MAG: toxic anion resistance protein [Clostridia bacterium]|nr:toxic anion resistance protein [Clostridia bacterium]